MTPQELDVIRARDADDRELTFYTEKPDDGTTDAIGAAFRDRRALLAEVDRLQARAVEDRERWVEQWQRALPVIEAARALLAEHTETVSQGYHSWDDPVCRDSESERRPGHHYGWMSACSSCGTPDEYAEPWPCTAHPALRAALAEYDR